MAQFDETQMNVCGVKNNMINYRGELFSIHMPLINMQRFIKNDCSNCKKYARWQGCIIGLCTNCEMDYTGCGFKDIGLECNSNFKQSANNTYLKGVNWNEIGDTDLDCNSINIEKEVHFVIHPTKEEVYVKDTTKLPYTYTFYSTRDELNKDETPEDRLQKIQEYCDEAYERFQEKEEEVAVTEEQLTTEIRIKKRLEMLHYSANTYSFREYDEEEEVSDSEDYPKSNPSANDFQEANDPEYQEEDQEEDQAAIEFFLTENGKEDKWFEMTLAEFLQDEENEKNENQENENQEELFESLQKEPKEEQKEETSQITLKQICEAFSQGEPVEEHPISTFNLGESDEDEEKTEFHGWDAINIGVQLVSIGCSWSTITDESIEGLQINQISELQFKIIFNGFNYILDKSCYPYQCYREDEYTDLPDLCDDSDSCSSMPELIPNNETMEEYELRTQTGIFDWPTLPQHRLNEDECYIGIKLSEKTVYDPY